MLKRIWAIFTRDVKVNMRNFISLYILVVPLILAFAINLFTPGINDTTINLALLEADNSEQIAYFKSFAKVELFKDVESVQKRVEARDNIVGILPEGDKHYIMIQGNEPEGVIDYAKLINSLNELDIQVEDTNAEIIEFGKTVPPLKRKLVNGMLLLITILGGMLIAFNIVEEKADRTIRSINVTPTTRSTFILGKSLFGLVLPIFGTIATVFICGFGDVNLLQILLIVSAASLLSLLVGFIQGLSSDDIISAISIIKLLFLPLFASVLAIELLSAKWQKFFYWSPFYWAYKGNNAVLSQTSTWQQILSYTGTVIVLCGIVYLIAAPRIRKGLE